MKLGCPMYRKQTNKMSSKSLVMLNVRPELVYMQYNISDSQALFWCSVILLEMASLNTISSYVLWDSKPDFVLRLFLILYQNQDCCSYKKEFRRFRKNS